MQKKFNSESEIGEALYKWWQELENHTNERADLRRAKTVGEVFLLPVFQRACIQFSPYFKYEKNWEDRFAAILGLLAHVRENSDSNLALLMAGKPKPNISELRFRRLIQRNRQELYVAMIRVIRSLNNTVNIFDLANSVYYWGNTVKKEWSFEYYSNI